jgi:DNA-binding transcriptional MerR regulator
MPEDYTLDELAKKSGLSLRTLRFYMQEGLLQGPDSRGKFARYSSQHLERLALIQRLKSMRLPLQEIRQILDGMSPEEIQQFCQKEGQPDAAVHPLQAAESAHYSIAEEGSSALDYLKNLEQAWGKIPTHADLRSPAPAASQPSATLRPKFLPPSPVPGQPDQEPWRRYVIIDGVELQVRGQAPADGEDLARILEEFARKIRRNKSQKGAV